jgi:hypothetical protein
MKDIVRRVHIAAIVLEEWNNRLVEHPAGPSHGAAIAERDMGGERVFVPAPIKPAVTVGVAF